MAIKKTKNGTYQLRLYIPEDVQPKLGIGKLFEKRYKTRREAKEAETKLSIDIQNARVGKTSISLQNKGDILFQDFYRDVWLEPYKAGQTTTTVKPPTKATVFQTENIFRLHILPTLGNYSLDHLINNKQLVLSLLTPKANSYANFKALRSYINSVFDWAEELEYISSNKLRKTISRIKANKKILLKENKREEDLALDQEELRIWLQAFDSDLKKGLIELKDYTLFYTTFFLSDRKSETYALQWKHINFETNEILIEQALDRFGNVKSTKGNKKTIFKAPSELMELLTKWKIQQQKELKLFGLRQSQKQFVFTYNDRSNNINIPLHTDYLNYRMNSVRRRHPELSPASPHKLRHTGATLARKSGVPLEVISEALTHSDKEITKSYVNTKDIVKQTAGDIAFRSLKI
ncbi:tyrosine-type recombinase/integrase [Streptococcus dysgalactiae]|uniref:Integrase n=2 Tax=Streptococcus dysgalactiae TaxID=1334 RepID=A0ABU0A976_STRDY|nr:site-specific integrase [Streptococcus dysgalactiae]ADX23799.1 phage integrase family integrase/recombinase [Streptococcus dysgalactiae subsp. equisimilis ATCC 12394]EGL49668.1 site-specific recombinase, phage integrase family [Streptococcus dysgalactiae subsp. equisimilis SK1249]BAN92702.1 phage integrase family integrase [Streptococcus dysgalactiae subsp. equisimilis 167]MDQ0263836.1 integrase [Streptococcus dysgalactiae]OBY98796.1 integrase [Streptococcus dysgalactiae subsp. equisimilis]